MDSYSRNRIRSPFLSALFLPGLFLLSPLPAAGAGLVLSPTSEDDGDFFGFSIAGVGDIDGDGFADFAVGAPRHAGIGSFAGRTYLFRGAAVPSSEFSLAFDPQYEGGQMGRSLALAGDFDGDGHPDIVVGAPGPGDLGPAYFLLSGGPGMDGAYDDVKYLLEYGSATGHSVSGAGDLNGDGSDDIAIGNPQGGYPPSGWVHLCLGGLSANLNPDHHYGPQSPGEEFGSSVAFIGDVNGDGFADLLVGAPKNAAGGLGAGRAYLYFGGAALDAVVYEPDLVLTGEAAGDAFGWSAAAAGDVNGDTYADFIVGAYGNDAGGLDAGRAYVFFGSALPDATPDLVLTGESAGDLFGISVGQAGDIQGDGYSDLLVGASRAKVDGVEVGRAYLYWGAEEPTALPALALPGEAEGDRFGISVAGVGDMNGDALLEIAVGAHLNQSAGPAGGKVYVFTPLNAVDAPQPTIVGGARLTVSPNPASGAIRYTLLLDRSAIGDVQLYDVSGRLRGRLAEGASFAEGLSSRSWTPSGLESGIYLVRARVDGMEMVERLVWFGN